MCLATDDQDELSTLSTNMMACKQVLVLCGPEYLTHLRCIMDVFVPFAFTGQDAALATRHIQVQ